MKIECPTCLQAVPSDQVNMSTDLALCPQCDEAFKISESVGLGSARSDVLRDPPKGAWFREEMDKIVVGASTRSPFAIFLVPFSCVWSGFAIGGLYGSQIASGEFDLYHSLFGIPFILGSIMIWGMALMAIGGKYEVRIGKTESTVFAGIGTLGWTRHFDWSAVQTIREVSPTMQYPYGALMLEGTHRLKFGTGLNESRRYFLLNALKYLKAESR